MFKKIFLTISVVLIALWSATKSTSLITAFYFEPAATGETEEAIFESYSIDNLSMPSVHSATAVALADGAMLAMWYGGTREGHKDVQLFSAVFDPKLKSWSTPIAVLDREMATEQLDRYIKKIGNPILMRHPSGAIVLIYVSVSMAGWATSHINMAVSYDNGHSWHDSKRITSTPFFNISTLVKNDGVIYSDGSIGIAAYQELLGEFSEIIRVNLDGEVLDKYRISDGNYTIQPTIVMNNENAATAYLRDTSHHTEKVHVSNTVDAGRTWSAYEPLDIDNPNSAVFAFIDEKQRHWLVLNDHNRQDEFPRNNLVLTVQTDTGKWLRVHDFENTQDTELADSRFSYPWVEPDDNGHFHLFYTWNRKHIKHIKFNQVWLESLL